MAIDANAGWIIKRRVTTEETKPEARDDKTRDMAARTRTR